MTEVTDLFAQSAALRMQCNALRMRIHDLSREQSSGKRLTGKRLTETRPDGSATGSPVNTLYLRLEATIRSEQECLAPDEELQITYAGPGDEIITIFSIGCQGHDLILLYGEDEDGQVSTVMLQDNSVALVMKNVKIPYQFERREIGFRGDIEKNAAASDPWRMGPPVMQKH